MPAATRRPAGALLLTAAALLVPAASAAARPHDRNHDRVPDRWEHRHHVASAAGDPDRDGLVNRFEFLSGTDPRRADSDGDGVPDAREDRDRDGVDNGTEQRARLDPRRRDSDGDRLPDAREDGDRDGLGDGGESRLGWDPRDADSDGDGVKDGAEHAGVVSAVSGSLVTIDLAAGGSLSGRLTANTAVVCAATGDVRLDGASDDSGDDWADVTPADAGEDPSAGDDDPGSEDAGSDDPGSDGGAGDPTDGACAAAVRPGAIVYGAELSLGADGTVFDELDLVGE